MQTLPKNDLHDRDVKFLDHLQTTINAAGDSPLGSALVEYHKTSMALCLVPDDGPVYDEASRQHGIAFDRVISTVPRNTREAGSKLDFLLSIECDLTAGDMVHSAVEGIRDMLIGTADTQSDEALLSLHDSLIAEYVHHNTGNLDDEKADTSVDRMAEIERQISQMPAYTVAGLALKFGIAVSEELLTGEPEHVQDAMFRSLHDDFERMVNIETVPRHIQKSLAQNNAERVAV